MTRGDIPCLPVEKDPPASLRLGVARDEAFCFYYEANLAALRQHGVELVPFSPRHDPALPENLDGIYLGGGYPELYMKDLNANESMTASIRNFAEDHFVYGECGGYLYLLDSLENFAGETLPGLGLLPGRARMNRKLASLGYREALLVGHAGKLVKLAGGIMNTHSRCADCRAELFTAHAALCGAEAELCRQLMDAVTTEAMLDLLEAAGLRKAVLSSLLSAMQRHLDRRAGEGLRAGAVIFSNAHGLLGMTDTARELTEAWR